MGGVSVCLKSFFIAFIFTFSSVSQIKVWTANPQQFVEDEDDDTFSYSVRISAQDLLLVRAQRVSLWVFDYFPSFISNVSSRPSGCGC